MLGGMHEGAAGPPACHLTPLLSLLPCCPVLARVPEKALERRGAQAGMPSAGGAAGGRPCQGCQPVMPVATCRDLLCMSFRLASGCHVIIISAQPSGQLRQLVHAGRQLLGFKCRAARATTSCVAQVAQRGLPVGAWHRGCQHRLLGPVCPCRALLCVLARAPQALCCPPSAPTRPTEPTAAVARPRPQREPQGLSPRAGGRAPAPEQQRPTAAAAAAPPADAPASMSGMGIRPAPFPANGMGQPRQAASPIKFYLALAVGCIGNSLFGVLPLAALVMAPAWFYVSM